MQQIVLATYGYFPYFWGGSEVYVHGLAQFLQSQGYKVVVIAGILEEHLEDCEGLYDDAFLKAGVYEYEGIKVIGCVNQVTTTEIYSRYNPAWKESWLKLMEKFWKGEPAVSTLHLHAWSSLVNASLVEAARVCFPAIKTVCSYHVPESCPKGTLVQFNSTMCVIKPEISTCTACVLQNRLGTSPGMAKMLGQMMPGLPLPDAIPTLLRIKSLTGLSIENYSYFAGLVDRWLVFSHQIEATLLRYGIAPAKMKVLRHGIDDRFFEDKITPAASDERSNKNAATIFTYIGRFKKVKGILTLLKAWMLLEESPARSLVLIGGDKDMDPEIASVLEKAKFRKDVHCPGFLPVEEVRSQLKKTHCIIVPSEWVEIGPLVIHEAIACGANVITVDIGGCAELADFYGENCQTYQMANEKDLAGKIENFSYRPVTKKVQSMSEHYANLLPEYRNLANVHREESAFTKK